MAPFMSVVVFMAPIPTILHVARDRTVRGLPLLPYSSMIANTFLYVMYGKHAPQRL